MFAEFELVPAGVSSAVLLLTLVTVLRRVLVKHHHQLLDGVSEPGFTLSRHDGPKNINKKPVKQNTDYNMNNALLPKNTSKVIYNGEVVGYTCP